MSKFPDIPSFDDSKPLVVLRPFNCVGKTLQTGDLFNWQAWGFPQRRVTQFWDLRQIANPTEELLSYLESTGADKDKISKARKVMKSGVMPKTDDFLELPPPPKPEEKPVVANTVTGEQATGTDVIFPILEQGTSNPDGKGDTK